MELVKKVLSKMFFSGPRRAALVVIFVVFLRVLQLSWSETTRKNQYIYMSHIWIWAFSFKGIYNSRIIQNI